MASILEMCVDYLQIVNSVMPQQLHNQVTTLMIPYLSGYKTGVLSL